MDTDVKLQFIRQMFSSDLCEVASLDRTVFRDHSWSFDDFEQCLTISEKSGWIVEEINRKSSSLIAYCILSSSNGETHLQNICVHPDWQGNGVGKKLLQHVINHSVDLGNQSVKLEVRVENDRAITFYKNFGFGIVGYIGHYYEDGMDAYIMGLKL